MTEHFHFAKGGKTLNDLAKILQKINTNLWKDNVQWYLNPTYSICDTLYEWEMKIFLNKEDN